MDNDALYTVVVNNDEQYSIWPADREVLPGWREVGQRGTKAACLEYIQRVWTGDQPLNVRNRMREQAEQDG